MEFNPRRGKSVSPPPNQKKRSRSENHGAATGAGRPSHKYTHSESFARLKAVKESISGNLTSYQYLSVLDALLYRAVSPLVARTRWLDNYLAQILAWAVQNPKRKICGVDRSKLGSLITLFLLSESGTRRLKLVQQMKLDRTILFEALRNWTRVTEPFILDLEPNLEQLVHQTMVSDPQSLGLCYQQVNFWYGECLSFKNKILEKYTRLCLSTAQRDYVDIDHQVSLEDMVQIYLVTASKAIDKCDTEKGVLTTHITNWLMSAKNVALSTLDRTTSGAYGGDSSHKQSLGALSAVVELDDPDSGHVVSASMTAYREQQQREQGTDLSVQIQRVARVFDPLGYGRLSLGISQWLTNAERQTLRSLSLS